ncbi:hypothetical protein B0H14DRAFT_3426206 [Mycena olivaceomarginata]|nr:hypothetical protein B0H14DRAFT_3426206 [Mycena olivaceomarginata]
MCLPQAALALPPHSFVPPHVRPPCILDIAPNTALHFTLASATPNYPTPRDTAARSSRARFPPPYALIARCLRPRLGPRLGPRYLHHAPPDSRRLCARSLCPCARCPPLLRSIPASCAPVTRCPRPTWGP